MTEILKEVKKEKEKEDVTEQIDTNSIVEQAKLLAGELCKIVTVTGEKITVREPSPLVAIKARELFLDYKKKKKAEKKKDTKDAVPEDNIIKNERVSLMMFAFEIADIQLASEITGVIMGKDIDWVMNNVGCSQQEKILASFFVKTGGLGVMARM